MTRAYLIFLLTLLLSFEAVLAQQAIIPQPVNSESAEGQITIESEIGVVLDQENDLISKMLSNFATDLEPLGIEVNSGSRAESGASALLRITLKEEDSVRLGEEGYELSVGNGIVNLQAIEPAGVFNGLQTLRQLLPQKRIEGG